MPMVERYPESELVLDDELVYDDRPRRSVLLRREERPEEIVREGEVLAGKYRVERIPGRNGLGVVVQVRHLELGQEVTLKFLVPEACAYPEFVQRFVREARSAVRIQGEHVARVTDVGRLDSGAPYMVREYLRGPDLAEVLKVRGPLPVAEAVDYIIQACEGVAEGHALGVVHRNLRPTSMVLARRSDGAPLVKVFDFAAAESLHVNPFTERAVSLVGTSAIMASLPYLAPEQIRDPHDVDFRADVYSLGAVLYELLTGRAVYAADSAPALLAQVAADSAASVRSSRPDVPGALDQVVLRCLAKNRAIRYSSLADFVLALRPFASHEAHSSVDRVLRLGKLTPKLPELGEGRSSSSPPPSSASVHAPDPATPQLGRHGTLILPAAPRPTSAPRLDPSAMHDDVTTINPYAGYAAPVVISSVPPEPARPEPARRAAAAHEPVSSGPQRLTPTPPPLRTSTPPPLARVAVPPPLRQIQPAAPPSVRPPREIPAAPAETRSVPPVTRSSMSGLTRSWAVEEPSKPLFTKRRLVAVGAIATLATLGTVLAARSSRPATVVAAARPAAPPPRAEPAPAPPPAAVPPKAEETSAAAASASVAPPASPPVAAAAAASPQAAAVPPAPAAAAPVAPPAPVARVAAPVAPPSEKAVPAVAQPARVAAPAPAAPAPAPKARPQAAPRKPAPAEPKLAAARPRSTGDLFDDPK